VQTALIHIIRTEHGAEARLDVDWDGASDPGADAPRVSLGPLPPPPDDCPDWATFVSRTEGASPHFVTLGRALHDVLITGAIDDALNQLPGGPLRLLLKIEPEELDMLPWELMRAGVMTTFTDASRPMARVAGSFNAGLDLPGTCWPLRVMLIVGSRDELIRVDEEIGYVRDAFRRVCGLVDVDVLRLPRRKTIREHFKSAQPHVLHFVGHGGLDPDLGGYLRLDQEGDAGGEQWTAPEIYGDLQGGALRLAVLNACQSGDRREHRGSRAAAQGLAGLGVPAVISMQGPIRGQAAALFAKGLYGALAEGEPLDSAVASARNEVTEEAPANQRDYAMPALILGAPPERILNLAEGNPRGKLTGRLSEVLYFVDRLPRRRELWNGFRPDQQLGPKIFAITGPPKAGKGSLVKWSLGVASVRGFPIVYADFPDGQVVGSVDFLEVCADRLAESGTIGEPALADALAHLRSELHAYEAARTAAQDDGRPYDSPEHLYQKFSSLLKSAAAQQPVVFGIDGLAQLEAGEWRDYAVPKLIRPIAQGQIANVRIIVSLQENELAYRFPRQYFDQGQVEEIVIQLFPSGQFVELISQWLRARNYPREAFETAVNEVFASDIAQLVTWDTYSFEHLQLRARAGRWEKETDT
jgi:hypothetical protein